MIKSFRKRWSDSGDLEVTRYWRWEVGSITYWVSTTQAKQAQMPHAFNTRFHLVLLRNLQVWILTPFYRWGHWFVNVLCPLLASTKHWPVSFPPTPFFHQRGLNRSLSLSVLIHNCLITPQVIYTSLLFIYLFSSPLSSKCCTITSGKVVLNVFESWGSFIYKMGLLTGYVWGLNLIQYVRACCNL